MPKVRFRPSAKREADAYVVFAFLLARRAFEQLLKDVLRLRNDADFVLVDLRFLRREFDRIVQRADFIDQAEFESLLARVDAAACQIVDRLLQAVASNLRDVPFE